MIGIDKIYNEDCLEGMKNIDDGLIDCIICDMPYNMTANEYDKTVIDLGLLWEQLYRIIRNDGAILMFAQQPFTTKLISSNLNGYKYCWYWEKNQGTNFFHAKQMPIRKIEEIIVFNSKRYNPQMITNQPPTNSSVGSSNGRCYYGSNKRNYVGGSTERFPSNILYDFKCVDNYHRLHPNQKPTDLLEYMIKTYTNENDIVLDPFCGVASTCIAAMNTNRHYIGFEIDKNFFDLAEKRINEHGK